MTCGNKISVSNGNHVFTQLKPPVKVFSNNSRYSLLVAKDIIILEISLSIEPLKVLAELHFLGVKPYLSGNHFNNLTK